jgi:hypothetical protein
MFALPLPLSSQRKNNEKNNEIYNEIELMALYCRAESGHFTRKLVETFQYCLLSLSKDPPFVTFL